MTTISVDYINPFLMASSSIIKQMCLVEPKLGKPCIKEPVFLDNTLIIIIGFTGKINGHVLIAFDHDIACDIASKMIMMPVTELDDFAKSAIGELGNMIMGNTATIFSDQGIKMDITPPTVGTGSMSFTHAFAKNICVPLEYGENKKIEINIAIKGV